MVKRKQRTKREEPVFRPGGAGRLLDSSEGDLTDDERALLLAMAGVDAEAGGSLDAQGRAALDKLKDQVEGYDAEELTQAVKHLVTAKSRGGRRLEWPGLKRGQGKRGLSGK
jgi:hypothetical protein